MRPSDHLLVLWQWDTAVRTHRRAQDLARHGHSIEWGKAVTAAVIASSEAERALQSYTGTAGVVSPAETGRGY